MLMEGMLQSLGARFEGEPVKCFVEHDIDSALSVTVRGQFAIVRRKVKCIWWLVTWATWLQSQGSGGAG